MKLYKLVVVALLSLSSWGDIGLIYQPSDGRYATVYEDRGQVIYRRCLNADINELNRRCQMPAGQQPFPLDQGTFSVRLRALFKVPEKYQGVDGLEQIQREIGFYQNRLQDDLSETNRAAFEEKLKPLTAVQNRLIDINSTILAFLKDGRDRTIEHGLDEHSEFIKLAYTRFPIWFDGEKRWYVSSPGLPNREIRNACLKPWRLMNGGDLSGTPVNAQLPGRLGILQSPLAAKVRAGRSVWTGYYNDYGSPAGVIGRPADNVPNLEVLAPPHINLTAICIWE
ncbi:MAG: hypothetical protein HYR96_15195 [Deltaproteobacteria bacterium]|nr:hypothetical protein [Deltaproteobacteria bacterium]